MRLEMQDFYGQYIEIHNETSSGNVRIEVRTTEDFNNIMATKYSDCNVKTNISLDRRKLELFYHTLKILYEENMIETL